MHRYCYYYLHFFFFTTAVAVTKYKRCVFHADIIFVCTDIVQLLWRAVLFLGRRWSFHRRQVPVDEMTDDNGDRVHLFHREHVGRICA